MRIVTWNCNGALRRKTDIIDTLKADILIIQECEDPASSTVQYRSWAGQHIWAGSNRNRGLAVFLKNGNSLKLLDWIDEDLQQFLPVRINEKVDILAVWTKQVGSSRFAYIGQFWKYLQLHKGALHTNSVICGDFNSSSVWDKPGRTWNHSACVRELDAIGFSSLYHLATGETQGQESRSTFFLQRKLSKPYHIDYVFAPRERLSQSWSRATIGCPAEWLRYSDHMPVIVDL